MVRPAHSIFFLGEFSMSRLTDWTDEISERSSEEYDPYEYIENIDHDSLRYSRSINNFTWAAIDNDDKRGIIKA